MTPESFKTETGRASRSGAHHTDVVRIRFELSTAASPFLRGVQASFTRQIDHLQIDHLQIDLLDHNLPL